MFTSGLAEHFRNLLMSKNQKTTKLIDAGTEMENQYMQQAAKCSTNLIFLALQKLRECELNYKASRNQRLHVELTLIDIGFCQFNIESKKKNPQATVSSNNSPTIKPVPVEEKKLPVRPQSTVTIKHLVNENQQIENTEKPETKIAEQPEQKIEPDTEKEIETILETEEFVKEPLTILQIWQNIIEPYKTQIRLYVALNNSNPQITESGELVLTIKSETQKELIDEVENDVLNALKQSLTLSDLSIVYNIDEQIDEPVKEPQKSNSDILNSFIERNKSVETLVQRFGLKSIN
jgi:DNA polymerase-3 subunit gamma/tau